MSAWRLNKKVVGYLKKVGQLELRTINNAGHLVPMDQGEVALDMLKDFVTRALGEVASQ